MKQLNKIYTVIIAILLSANISHAQTTKTFYVCSGTAYTLNPQITTFSNYQWFDISNAVTPISIVSGLVKIAPVISNATYVMNQYTLRVQNGTTGCWSDPDTFTVYTLPPVSVAIAGADSAGYCTHNALADTLTATVASLTLPSGVAANQFAWTLNAVSTGANSAQLPINTGTVAGTSIYGLTVTYSLPTIIGGSKLTACSGVNAVSIIVNNVPTTPAISIL